GQNIQIRLPGTTLRVLEEDPNLGPASGQGSLQVVHRRNEGTSRTCSPKENNFSSRCGRVAEFTVSKFNSKYLQGTAPHRGLVLRRKCRNSEIYFYFIKESI
ncbi:hypothetical protein MTR67_038743, partial [Solanum verrucosum]